MQCCFFRGIRGMMMMDSDDARCVVRRRPERPGSHGGGGRKARGARACKEEARRGEKSELGE